MTEKAGSYAALLVENGRISRVTIPNEDDDGANTINRLIGNWFTSCFHVETEEGNSITGYCDDEFLLKGDPEEINANWNVVLEKGTLYGIDYAIGGPIVIVGHTYEGESRSLTENEMQRFFVDSSRLHLVGKFGYIRELPTLAYRQFSEIEAAALDEAEV